MDWSTPGLPVSLTISWSLPKFMSIALVMPYIYLILRCPLLLLPSIFPTIRDFSKSRLFASDDQNTGASASASVLLRNIQDWFPLRLTGLISWLSKGLSRVFESINSSALSLLCDPVLAFMHDYWKNHSFDSTNLCKQSDISAFQHTV